MATGADQGGEPPVASLDYGLLNELVGHLLRHAFLRGHQVFGEVFAGEALTPLQFMVLELVDRNPGITHRDVAAAMSSAPSVLTTALKPLVTAGLLEQVRVAEDGRRVAYRLSSDGLQRFRAMRPRIAEAERLLLAGFDEAEAETLRTFLRRITGRA
ncbi:MarR family winged helix-turn-helix transcriptional regulator [Stappia indica]|uniref:MarR family winged helix-turn-helix transcriptional regulator n=1 Tax=Stappia indica TaxID=538381 RepID=UPI00082F9D94|nr:MarR family transcriptional regulator [Stappia indica]